MKHRLKVNPPRYLDLGKADGAFFHRERKKMVISCFNIDLEQSKKLHKWITKAIAHFEDRERVDKLNSRELICTKDLSHLNIKLE